MWTCSWHWKGHLQCPLAQVARGQLGPGVAPARLCCPGHRPLSAGFPHSLTREDGARSLLLDFILAESTLTFPSLCVFRLKPVRSLSVHLPPRHGGPVLKAPTGVGTVPGSPEPAGLRRATRLAEHPASAGPRTPVPPGGWAGSC